VKYAKIEFKNIGPIESGQIRHKKVSVFFGSNNSGKSIAAGLTYGVCRLSIPVRNKSVRTDLFGDGREGAGTNMAKHLCGERILESAGMPRDRVATAGKNSCMLKVHASGESTMAINFRRPRSDDRSPRQLDGLYEAIGINDDSFYVPAGRTGIVRHFMSIYGAKNKMLGHAIDALARHQIVSERYRRVAKQAQPPNLPYHSERLYHLISQERRLAKDVQDMFSRLFQGSAALDFRDKFSRIMYEDPSGFQIELDHAGAGMASSLPVLMSLHRVADGGTLVVEEPEAHLEPVLQMRLAEDLVAAAGRRKISLIFCTHSDFVLKKLLTMTVSKKIKRQDLGLYYFKRAPGEFTRIEELVPNKDGEIPQDMFDEAMDAIVEEILN